MWTRISSRMTGTVRTDGRTAARSTNAGAAPKDSALALEVHQILAGNASALAALYDSTVSTLYAIACSTLRCPHDAEEVVCDVFLFVWLNAHRYDAGRGSVMAWLVILTRSRSLDRLRKRCATIPLRDEQASSPVAPPRDDPQTPEEHLREFEANSRASGVLALQSPVRRQLIALSFFDGLCHEEIAKATGLPLGSVKSHIRRTLKSMRTMLEKN